MFGPRHFPNALYTNQSFNNQDRRVNGGLQDSLWPSLTIQLMGSLRVTPSLAVRSVHLEILNSFLWVHTELQAVQETIAASK